MNTSVKTFSPWSYFNFRYFVEYTPNLSLILFAPMQTGIEKQRRVELVPPVKLPGGSCTIDCIFTVLHVFILRVFLNGFIFNENKI